MACTGSGCCSNSESAKAPSKCVAQTSYLHPPHLQSFAAAALEATQEAPSVRCRSCPRARCRALLRRPLRSNLEVNESGSLVGRDAAPPARAPSAAPTAGTDAAPRSTQPGGRGAATGPRLWRYPPCSPPPRSTARARKYKKHAMGKNRDGSLPCPHRSENTDPSALCQLRRRGAWDGGWVGRWWLGQPRSCSRPRRILSCQLVSAAHARPGKNRAVACNECGVRAHNWMRMPTYAPSRRHAVRAGKRQARQRADAAGAVTLVHVKRPVAAVTLAVIC